MSTALLRLSAALAVLQGLALVLLRGHPFQTHRLIKTETWPDVNSDRRSAATPPLEGAETREDMAAQGYGKVMPEQAVKTPRTASTADDCTHQAQWSKSATSATSELLENSSIPWPNGTVRLAEAHHGLGAAPVTNRVLSRSEAHGQHSAR